MWRLAKVVLLAVCAQGLFAAEPPKWVSAELNDVEFRARLVRDVNEIQSRLGDDLDQEFILVELHVRPLYNSEVILRRDDFLLRSFRNNDRSYAQSPDRIAGEAVLVLNEGGGGGGVFAGQNETVIGGGFPGQGLPDIPGPASGSALAEEVRVIASPPSPSRRETREPSTRGSRPSSCRWDPRASP